MNGTAFGVNDYLIFNFNTHVLSIDTDGYGIKAAMDIVVWTGDSRLSIYVFKPD